MGENVNGVDDKVEPKVTEKPKTDYVAKNAYEEVSKDMHKYKSQLKEAEAARNAAEAALKAVEDQKLIDQNRFEELYNQEKQKSEEAMNKMIKERQLYDRSVKVNALKAELGGKIKDDYLSFANLDNIEVLEDGTISSESVRTEANNFRQAHPQLIPVDGNADITSTATTTSFDSKEGVKISDMSFEAKARYLNELKKQ